jgi:hypothetical protein
MRKINIAILATIAATLSACTGMELGAKVGLYRVDERQESQRTHNVPLKCYLWANCAETVENNK